MIRLCIAAAVCLILFGCSDISVIPDHGLSPALVGDSTALIQACGNQPIVGFTYCRVSEGDAATQSVTFIGPPAECKQDACVYIKVFNQSGQLVWGGSLPKGQTHVSVSWKVLLAAEQFQLGMRGQWGWTERVLWVDPDGNDRQSITHGDIVLRVYKAGYQGLEAVSDDENFVWEWKDGKTLFKMTSSLRTFTEHQP